MRHLSNLGLGSKKILSFTPSTPQKETDDRNCNKANTDLDSTRQGLSTDILIIYFACGVLEIQFRGRLTIRVAHSIGSSVWEVPLNLNLLQVAEYLVLGCE